MHLHISICLLCCAFCVWLTWPLVPRHSMGGVCGSGHSSPGGKRDKGGQRLQLLWVASGAGGPGRAGSEPGRHLHGNRAVQWRGRASDYRPDMRRLDQWEWRNSAGGGAIRQAGQAGNGTSYYSVSRSSPSAPRLVHIFANTVERMNVIFI